MAEKNRVIKGIFFKLSLTRKSLENSPKKAKIHNHSLVACAKFLSIWRTPRKIMQSIEVLGHNRSRSSVLSSAI
uniref:Uncharacterized protein n=1 Tax=Anopheles atroparvus TaxID=41427 RepID=A0AAG5DLW6_ANOAO